MTTEFVIRAAQSEDASNLTDLIRGLGIFAYFESEEEATTMARIEQYLHKYLAQENHSIYVVDTEANMIVGYVAVHWLTYLFLPGPEGYITELFILSMYRGKGLGTRLLSEVEIEAKKRGVARLTLINNNTRESYQREFYKKQGWQAREQMVSFVKLPAED
ncbi:GNAT family N-acetyltransferase [Anaerolineales bacterium HSG24]|nr:GNAT family N-acetyltransferase [Anaerolineales bacterium HSG24]